MHALTRGCAGGARSMEARQLREDEDVNAIIRELLLGSDNAMLVDCAGPTVHFVVQGWFVFPKGSLSKAPDVPSAA